MSWTLRQLERAAGGQDRLRPFCLPGWVTDARFMARSSVVPVGRPVVWDEATQRVGAPKTPADFLQKYLTVDRAPAQLVGNHYDDFNGESPALLGSIFESHYGLTVLNERYAQLLDGLKTVHLRAGHLRDDFELSPIGGVDDAGELQIWIMPVRV